MTLFIVDTSPAFEEFLEFLGEKVRLKGWDKYNGGLDVERDRTGQYSVYTCWNNLQFM